MMHCLRQCDVMLRIVMCSLCSQGCDVCLKTLGEADITRVATSFVQQHHLPKGKHHEKILCLSTKDFLVGEAGLEAVLCKPTRRGLPWSSWVWR